MILLLEKEAVFDEYKSKLWDQQWKEQQKKKASIKKLSVAVKKIA